MEHNERQNKNQQSVPAQAEEKASQQEHYLMETGFEETELNGSVVPRSRSMSDSALMLQKKTTGGDSWYNKSSSAATRKKGSISGGLEKMAESAANLILSKQVIVGNDTKPGTGQMTQQKFLHQLDLTVRKVADPLLAKKGRSTDDCPWLYYALQYYGYMATPQEIQLAINTYVPSTQGATSALELISRIGTHVYTHVNNWVTTGKVGGYPEDALKNLQQVKSKAPADKNMVVHRKEINTMETGMNSDAASVHHQLEGEGESLDGSVRAKMEGALGSDLSGVKIHTGGTGSQIAEQQNAKALAVGQHIAFGSGQYKPGTMHGDALLAHELAHTIQQKNADGNMQAKNENQTSYNAYEQEADDVAVGTVSSLWGSSKEWMSGLGKKTGAALRSGLQLQKCSDGYDDNMKQGKEQYSLGNYDVALTFLQDAIKARPGDKEAQKYIDLCNQGIADEKKKTEEAWAKGLTKASLSDVNTQTIISGLTESQLYQIFTLNPDVDVQKYVGTRLLDSNRDRAAIAEFVHDELIKTNSDEEIILVNLQKLNKDQTKIDYLVAGYFAKYGTQLEGDLRGKLTGEKLQLALEMINLTATVGQTNILNITAPAVTADYTRLATLINTGLYSKPVSTSNVYAGLIPLQRDPAKATSLATEYASLFPGHTLETDIRTQITNTNEQSYALYLLFAPPTGTAHDDTGGITNFGTQIFSNNIKGGAVTANTGVNYGTYTNGYSLDYTGGLADDAKWLQFIWREVVYWQNVGGTLVERRLSGRASGQGAHNYNLTDTLGNIQYSTDAGPPPKSPFYEETGTDVRTTGSTKMLDAPSSNAGLVTSLFGAPYNAQKVVIAAHFNTYLVRDFLPVERVNVDVEYIYNTATDVPAASYTNGPPVSTSVSSLDPKMKSVLDTQYNKKYSYIR